MKWTSGQILKELQNHAERFEFPILDNANWRYIAGRLRGFHQGHDWALTFELFIYQTAASAFAVQVYGYGPLVESDSSDLGAIEIVSECADDPLWDEEGRWTGALDGSKDVIVAGRLVRVSTKANVPYDVVLSLGDTRDELTFGAALMRELGRVQLLPESSLSAVNLRLQPENEILRLSDWDHPDIAAGASVSTSRALVGAARILSGEDGELQYDHSRDNTHWSKWSSSESAA
jgi:hypothetical protein